MYRKPNILRDFFTFSGRVSANAFWSSFFVSLVIVFCLLIVACMVVSAAVPGGVEELAKIMEWISAGMGVIWFARIAALSRRRLRDGGYTAKSYLWLLLPGIGLIAFIVRLCSRSKN